MTLKRRIENVEALFGAKRRQSGGGGPTAHVVIDTIDAREAFAHLPAFELQRDGTGWDQALPLERDVVFFVSVDMMRFVRWRIQQMENGHE